MLNIAKATAVDGEEDFWRENAQLLTGLNDEESATNVVRITSTKDVQEGFTFCRDSMNEQVCTKDSGTYDLLQNSEGLLDEAIKLMFRPPAGKSVSDYKFRATSSNEELLKDDKIGIDPIRSADASGDLIVNATIGVSFEPTVGEVDLMVRAEDQKGNDDREFKLGIAVAGLMFTDSDVSTPQKESEYLAAASRFRVPIDVAKRQVSAINTVSRMDEDDKGDRYVAEGRFENNILQITSWESLARNRYVYIKVAKLFKTKTMKKPLRIRDIKVEFESETYAKQIKWSEGRCRIAVTSKRPVPMQNDPKARPDPEFMSRPRPGFLKGMNPKQAVNLTRSECGISFSYTGDLLGLRFEKYRVGQGQLRIHFKLKGFRINDRPVSFDTDLRILIVNHKDAPPAYHRVDTPGKLDPNGGDELRVLGFNVPKDTNQPMGMAVMIDGTRTIFPEDPSQRRAHDRYDMQMTFVSLPGAQKGEYQILLTPQGKEMRSTTVDGRDLAELEGTRIFKPVSRDRPLVEYKERTESTHDDIDYTFGFVNATNLQVARLLKKIRRKYGEASGIGSKKVSSIDCEAGSFYAIHGRTGIIAGLSSSSSGAATKSGSRLLSLSLRKFFEDWTQVTEEEIGTPPPLPSEEPITDGAGNIVGTRGIEIVRKMEGEKVRLRFSIPKSRKVETMEKIEEYTASGRAMSDFGIETHMVSDSETEQIRFAGGTLNIAALTSLVATIVAAVGVQMGSAIVGVAAVGVGSAAISVDPALSGGGGVATATGKYTSSNANPTTILRAVQVASARGFVSSKGVTSPYKNVAEDAKTFLLLVRPPWKSGDPTESPAVRFLRSAKTVVDCPWREPVSENLQTQLSSAVRVAQPISDILNDKNIEGIFIGQLFYIAVAAVVFAILHTTIHFGLKKRKRARTILLNILPKIYLLFLNYIFLGIIIGGFRLLLSDRKVYLKVIAGVLMFVFGLGYPASVLWVLRAKVAPNLNQAWMQKYTSRYILRGGWSWLRRYSDEELKHIEGTWRKRDMENPFAQHWFVERRTRRFSGVWCSRDKFQARFGDIFEQYRGQYYAFFFWELLELAIEGIALGAFSNFPTVQAVIIITVSIFNMGVLFWLVPYNDVLEQVVQLFIGFVNVLTAAVAVVLLSVQPVQDKAKFYSTLTLWLNISAIIGASIYAIFAAAEILWHSREKITKFFRRRFNRGGSSSWSTSRSSSSRSSSSRSTSTSIPSDDLLSDGESTGDLMEDTYFDSREPYKRDGSPLEVPASTKTNSSDGRLEPQTSTSAEDSALVSDRTLSSSTSASSPGGSTLTSARRNHSAVSRGSGDQFAMSDKGSDVSGERAEVAGRARGPVRVLSYVRPPNSKDSNWTDEFDVCSSVESTANGSIGARDSTLKPEDLKDKKRSYVLGALDKKQTWDGGEEILDNAARRSSAGVSSSTSSGDTLSRRSSRQSHVSDQSSTTRRSSRLTSESTDHTLDDVHAVD